MKILFAIQGTGNGHLSRAKDVYPELTKYGEVDVLISGIQADVNVLFPVKYKAYGMSFIFGKKGGVDILATAKKLKLFKLIKDIRNFPIEQYDIVINDFEPISAWACKRTGLMPPAPARQLFPDNTAAIIANLMNEHAPSHKQTKTEAQALSE